MAVSKDPKCRQLKVDTNDKARADTKHWAATQENVRSHAHALGGLVPLDPQHRDGSSRMSENVLIRADSCLFSWTAFATDPLRRVIQRALFVAIIWRVRLQSNSPQRHAKRPIGQR